MGSVLSCGLYAAGRTGNAFQLLVVGHAHENLTCYKIRSWPVSLRNMPFKDMQYWVLQAQHLGWLAKIYNGREKIVHRHTMQHWLGTYLRLLTCGVYRHAHLTRCKLGCLFVCMHACIKQSIVESKRANLKYLNACKQSATDYFKQAC